MNHDEITEFINQNFCAADRGRRFSDHDSFVVPPLCFHKRYKGDTWWFQCNDSSIFLGCNLFALFSKETIGIYRWLCRTLDEMMDSTVRPQINYEAETLLARISHRLERLYHVMQETRHKVEEEKAELQSLVSDISHQTKNTDSKSKNAQ